MSPEFSLPTVTYGIGFLLLLLLASLVRRRSFGGVSCLPPASTVRYSNKDLHPNRRRPTMYPVRLAVTAVALLASAVSVAAQDKGAKKGGGPPPMINIKVADFADGSRIPERFT